MHAYVTIWEAVFAQGFVCVCLVRVLLMPPATLHPSSPWLMGILLGRVVSFLMKGLAILAFYMMSKEDVLSVLEYYKCAQKSPSDDDDGDSISDWSCISDEVRYSDPPVTKCRQDTAKNITDPDERFCKHKHVTRLGSNHFKIQIKCKDCGALLLEQQTPAGVKCSSKKISQNKGYVGK